MEDLSKLYNDVLTTVFDVKSQHWVELTHITNPHHFYVRPTKYKAFVEKIESTKPKARPSSLNLHDIIIFKMNHESDKAKYARGKVFDIVSKENTTKYTILALDYGCLNSAVPENHIWKCNEEYLNLAPLAQACELANCQPIEGDTWSKNSIDAFKDFVGNEITKMIIRDKTLDRLIVVLRNSNPDDIATLMAYTEYSTLGYVHNAVNRIIMEEIERMVADLTLNSFDTERIHWVEVTHVIDPSQFYVRPVKYKPMIKLFESTEPSNKLKPVNIQDLVVFNLGHSCGGRKFIRGRITRIEKSDDLFECNIFAIDYGFLEKAVPLEKVWECSQELLNIPPLAYDCQLANCLPVPPKGFPPDAIHAFKYYAAIEPIKMRIFNRKPGKILVELINSIPESIATLLAIGGYSMLGSYFETIAWHPLIGRKTMFFEFKNVSINDKLRVKVQSGSLLTEFHVVEVSDYEKHMRDEVKFISHFARREFPISPDHFIEGKLICVKNENNEYDRAFIKKITAHEERAIVQLVDWGRDEEYPIYRIRYMSPQCLRTPVLSIYCKTETEQTWDNGLVDLLTPGSEFIITIKQLGYQFERPHTVEITPLEEFGNEAAALPEASQI